MGAPVRNGSIVVASSAKKARKAEKKQIAAQQGRLTRRITVALFAMTFIVYFRALFNGFIVGYDDSEYVLQNVDVLSGLTASGIWYAFTGVCVANWHPLTMLSHMVDCQFFGIAPWGHHLTSVLFHAANTTLLFLVLVRMTGAPWRSAAVAALFSLHPMHVQAVANVAQRKDVLSTFFWLLTMLAYVRYTRLPRWSTYLWVAVFLALGLMAKPMLVTLPVILLLLDWWPLNRLNGATEGGWPERKTVIRLCREKLPLLGIAAVSSVITVIVQSQAGAVASLEGRPLALRTANALIAYVAYLGKAVLPVHLAAFYPYAESYTALKVGAATALLVAITALTLWKARSSPYYAVGWFWYLIALTPVIGIIQVGQQAMADRYTYVPYIGLFIAVSWGLTEATRRSLAAQKGLKIAAAVVLALFAFATWRELGFWKNGETLWIRALAVTRDNANAHGYLGAYYANEGDFTRALEQREEAVQLDAQAPALTDLATSLMKLGRFDEARSSLVKALGLEPSNSIANFRMGELLARTGKLAEAEMYFDRIPKDDIEQYVLAANVFLEIGSYDRAESQLLEAVRLDPSNAGAWYTLGGAYEAQGHFDQALDAYREALRLKPILKAINGDIRRVEAQIAQTPPHAAE